MDGDGSANARDTGVARITRRGPFALPAVLRAAVRAIDADAAQERAAVNGYDRAPWIAFVTAALCLTAMEYGTGPRVLRSLLQELHATFPERVPEYALLSNSRWYPLLDLGLWVATRALALGLVPALVIRGVLRRPVADCGLHIEGLRRHLGSYAWLFALMLPVLLLSATRPEFMRYYPLYMRAGDSWFDLVFWELIYAFQFFCVEFFFRGFLLLTTRRSLGSYAVLAAMLPYCMVHFQKPLLEVLATIPAAIVLGLLALSTRSIWGGVLLHVAVAWTLDTLSLIESGKLPTRLWPE